MLDEIKKIKLGGFEQKIHIRSNNNGPILLVLHGGPGIPNRSSLFTKHLDLCDHFTLVGWDQRGTGGSYKGIDPKTLTLEQYLIDTCELVDYLCHKFNQEKLFLLCGSWGTELGTMFCHKYPDKIFGYIGFGQTVSGEKNEAVSYQYALDEATKASDKKSIRLLEKYGPPIKGQYKEGIKGLMVQRKIMKKYGGNSTKKEGWFKTLVLPILLSREYTLSDKIGVIKGYSLVLSKMWGQITDYDFITDCNEFTMPYYIFQGRHDNNTPSSLIQEFYDKLNAPSKDLVWFENSAHNPLGEESVKFKSLLIEKFVK
ncbi:MAG: alpha/beta fold hydrolase [Christensenellaceae bacterium]|jgi:pimeloyl-ACP methyl ester carboxylesterase|nr:alpha/beta fold hydrolase [Christensenellaceae bacterium]